MAHDQLIAEMEQSELDCRRKADDWDRLVKDIEAQAVDAREHRDDALAQAARLKAGIADLRRI